MFSVRFRFIYIIKSFCCRQCCLVEISSEESEEESSSPNDLDLIESGKLDCCTFRYHAFLNRFEMFARRSMVKQWSHMVSHEVNAKFVCYWSRLKLSFLRHFYGITHDLFPAINTFFYVKLREQGPDIAALWLPNVTSCRHLIVPLHLKGMHWALGVVMNLNATTLHEVFLFSEWMVRHQPAFIAFGRTAAMRVRIGFYGWARRSCFILPTYNRVLVKFILSK